MSVRYEPRGPVALITIDRPEKRNAVDLPTARALREAWVRFNDSDEAVAVLTGAGDQAFSAGADVTDLSDDLVASNFALLPGIGITVEKPIITAVGGWCVGLGVALVVYTDLCVAAEDAKFWYSEPKLGFSGGLLASLAIRVPTKIAFEFLTKGEPMSASRAYEVGFVNEVVPAGEQVTAALRLADTLAAHGPLALRLMKSYIAQSVPQGPTEQAMRTRLEIDAVLSSADRAEGIAAFREGRAPKFQGR